MTLDEFKEIAKRIEQVFKAAPGAHDFTDLEFENWLDAFKEEEVDVVNDAITSMAREYYYFPMIATLQSYIDKERRFREKIKEEKLRQQGRSLTEEDRKNERSRQEKWLRFIYWMLEVKKRPQTNEECFAMKAAFERDHPDWQPRKASPLPKSGPVRIDRVMKHLNLEN